MSGNATAVSRTRPGSYWLMANCNETQPARSFMWLLRNLKICRLGLRIFQCALVIFADEFSLQARQEIMLTADEIAFPYPSNLPLENLLREQYECLRDPL